MSRTENNDMVCPSKVAEIAKSSEGVKMEFNTLHYGISCYEAGMLEVLRDLALQMFDKGDICMKMSIRAAKRKENFLSKKEALEYSLSESLKPLLKDYEEACAELEAQENEDYFIEGFLKGYRYLKNHIEYHSYLKEDFE